LSGPCLGLFRKLTWEPYDKSSGMSAENAILKMGAVILFILTSLAFIFYGHSVRLIWTMTAPDDQKRMKTYFQQMLILLLFVFVLFTLWATQAVDRRYISEFTQGNALVDKILAQFIHERHGMHNILIYVKGAFVIFLVLVAAINAYTTFLSQKPGLFVAESLLMFGAGVFLVFGIMMFRWHESFPEQGNNTNDTTSKIVRLNIVNSIFFGLFSMVFYWLTEFSGMNAVSFTVLPNQPPSQSDNCCPCPDSASTDPKTVSDASEILEIKKRMMFQILGAVATICITIVLIGMLFIFSKSLGYYRILSYLKGRPDIYNQFMSQRTQVILSEQKTTESPSLWTSLFGNTELYAPSSPRNTLFLFLEALWFGFWMNIIYLWVAYNRNSSQETRTSTFFISSFLGDVIMPTFVCAFFYIILIATGTMDMFLKSIKTASRNEIEMKNITPANNIPAMAPVLPRS
jgi:hypothetical protein